MKAVGMSDATSPRPLPGSRLAFVAYLAVFPGFWVYHLLVAQGLLQPYLRGYSVAIAVVVLPLLTLAYVRHLRRGGRTNPMDALFVIFVAFWLLTALGHALQGADPAIVQSHLGSIPQWLSLYLITRLLDLRDLALRRAVRLAFAVMTAIVFANLSNESFALEAAEVTIDDRVSLATYQDFALIYLVTVLFFAVTCGSTVRRLMLYGVSTVTLFLVGARTEFVALLLSVLLVELCLARHRAAVLAGYGLFAISLALVLQAVVELSPENRVVNLVVRRADDYSVQERIVMTASALKTIAHSPLSGSFASYRPGEYAHNFLSAWVDLGLAGFLGLCVLLALPLLNLSLQFRSRAREADYVLVLTMLMVSILLLLSAKFFAYGLTPLAMGLYARSWLRLRSRGDAVRSAPQVTNVRQPPSPLVVQ